MRPTLYFLAVFAALCCNGIPAFAATTRFAAETEPPCACIIPREAPQKPVISGRGLWVWKVKTPAALASLVERASQAHVSWVAVKAGNRGTPSAHRDATGEYRNQFTPDLVDAFHARGILVFGWGWDEPCCIDKQVHLVRSVYDVGADGYISDAEVPWDRGQKKAATRFVAKMRAAVPSGFILADAPWDMREYHREFPYEEFGAVMEFRAPQVYWVAHGLSVERSFRRYLASWGTSGQMPSGSAWGTATPDQVAQFEALAKEQGLPGVLYWVHDSVTPAVFEWFKAHPW